jgi:superfamily II RNA helicase
VDIRQIKAIFDYRADIPEGFSSERLARLFREIPLHDLELLNIETFQENARSDQLDGVKKRLSSLPCEDCEHLKICHLREKGPLKRLLRDFRSLAAQMEGMGGGLWLSFKRHLRFLKESGFVDEADLLTADGIWASKLRLDQPLLIAEAIRTGAFDGASPEVLAGGLAPFVWDRALEVELRGKGVLNLSTLEARFNSIIGHIERLRTLKTKRGFESPTILFWPCIVLYLWAKNTSWDQLLHVVAIDEGDMASLIMRTADHLRQITNLKETHPQLAQLAKQAIELIQREPVYIP